jgi:hypothetical protein
MTGYKVFLKLKNGALMSAGIRAKSLRLHYSRSKTNFPKIKGSKLFVFKNFVNAKNFINCCSTFNGFNNKGKEIRGKLEIWKVKVPRCLSYKSKLPNCWTWDEEIFNENINYLENFWLKGTLKDSFSGQVSKNVYLTNSIKLVKKVK